ncbi:hypothetical protein QTP88_018814 [Uroleucon formosanum]
MADVVWDKQNTYKLLEFLESSPELRNCTLKKYRDRQLKAKCMEMSSAEVGRKLHNLRCQMNSELRKIKHKKNEMFEQSNLPESEVSDSNMSDDNYFNRSENKSKVDLSLEQEITKYFPKSPTKNLNIMNEMPTVKKVFLKFNTPLPSNTAVKRAFSIGGADLSKKKGICRGNHRILAQSVSFAKKPI